MQEWFLVEHFSIFGNHADLGSIPSWGVDLFRLGYIADATEGRLGPPWGSFVDTTRGVLNSWAQDHHIIKFINLNAVLMGVCLQGSAVACKHAFHNEAETVCHTWFGT